MSYTPNLTAYFSRIGCSPHSSPSLENLRTLALNHTQSIPFENIDSFLGVPVSLDPLKIEKKLLHSGRGGYCFEQNLLLCHMLEALGYSVRKLAARVLWGKPEDTITARTHMLLAVEIENGQWIIDAGFGGQTLTGVLALIPDQIQDSPHGQFRLLQKDGMWRMQVCLNGEWHTTYQFDWQRQYPQDFEISNYYISTHPNSPFVGRLVAARPTPAGRITLHNRLFTTYLHNGEYTQQYLDSSTAVCDILREAFGITVPISRCLIERLNSLS